MEDQDIMALSANQNDLKLFKLLEGSKAYLVMSKQTPVQSSVKAVVVPTSITVIYIFYFMANFQKYFVYYLCVFIGFLQTRNIVFFWGVNQEGSVKLVI